MTPFSLQTFTKQIFVIVYIKSNSKVRVVEIKFWGNFDQLRLEIFSNYLQYNYLNTQIFKKYVGLFIYILFSVSHLFPVPD